MLFAALRESADGQTRTCPSRSVMSVLKRTCRLQCEMSANDPSKGMYLRMRKRTVLVRDKMQKGYRYVLTAPVGRGFDPEFKPQLTPMQMLKLGVFCGKYMTIASASFQRVGLRRPSSRAGRAIAGSIFSGSTRANRWQNGDGRDGFIPATRAAGSNGIAATTWVAA